MQRVLVIDANEQPLMPCQPARARLLLREGKAAVYRRYPFTIILKERIGGDVQPIQVKVDPGSKATGIAVVVEGKRGKRVVWAAELEHRGQVIHKNMLSRSVVRRSRRNRHTRYRPSRFDNRRKPTDWLPPSLLSRVENVVTWVNRLRRFVPVTGLSQELIRFDTQLMQDAEISGVEYQQGELAGYEVRQYLLEKWDRTCAYCGKTDIPLQIEHLIPKSRGGTNRVSNLAIACAKCNQDKGNQTAVEYGYPQLMAQAKQPLKDTAAVNVTRWALCRRLDSTGLPVELGSGGRTKFNRSQQEYSKAHWIDAACVGVSGECVYLSPATAPLQIKAMGHGSRQMVAMSKYGFPKTKPKRFKRVHGFQTGDTVRAILKAGSVTGRVVVREDGGFEINRRHSASWKRCKAIHRADGYRYSLAPAVAITGELR